MAEEAVIVPPVTPAAEVVTPAPEVTIDSQVKQVEEFLAKQRQQPANVLQQEAPITTEPAKEEKPAEAPAAAEVKPAAEAAAETEVEFDTTQWDKEIEEILAQEQAPAGEVKPAAEKQKENLEQPTPLLKRLGEKIGINADTEEEFEKQLLSKLKGQEVTPLDEYNQQIGNLKKFADKSIVSDEQLLTAYYTEKYGNKEEAAEQVKDLKAQGEASIRTLARDIRATVVQKVTSLETNKDSFLVQQDELKKRVETEFATRVKTINTINGMPIPSSEEEDLKYITSKSFDKDLQNPDNYVLAAKLFNNREKLVSQGKSLSQEEAKKIYQKGYTQAANTFKQKLFNKDISGKTNGALPGVTEKVTVDSNVAKAEAAIRAKRGF